MCVILQSGQMDSGQPNVNVEFGVNNYWFSEALVFSKC